MHKIFFIVGTVMLAIASCSAGSKTDMEQIQPTDTAVAVVEIKTTMGDIRVLLYGDTPRHRDNFLKLVGENFYDSTLFHRVIPQFMIQGGDPASRNAPSEKSLGSGDPGYTLEAEILYPKHFHKRGALAAARQGDQLNPQKRSSGSQFYIVTGKSFDESELRQMEQNLRNRQAQGIFNSLVAQCQDTIMAMRLDNDRSGLQALQEKLVAQTEAEVAKSPASFTDEQARIYTTLGGAPHLDGEYTVFGEVISGMEVVEKIEKVPTGPMDRPLEDVMIISMSLVK